MGGVVEGVAAILPAAFEPRVASEADNQEASPTPVDPSPSFSADFSANPVTASSGDQGTVTGSSSYALKAAAASVEAPLPDESTMHAALVPLLPCLPPICPPSGRPEALPPLLLLSVRVLGAVCGRTEAGLSSGVAGTVSTSLQRSEGAGRFSPAMSYLSAAGVGSKEACAAVDFVRVCVREVWRHGDASREAAGAAGAAAAVGLPSEEDVMGVAEDADRGGVEAAGNGVVPAPTEVVAVIGEEVKEDAATGQVSPEEDDDDDWGEDDFQDADDFQEADTVTVVTAAAVAEPIETETEEVCAVEEPSSAANAETSCVGEEGVAEESPGVPEQPQVREEEEIAPAAAADIAETEGASLPEGEGEENIASPVSKSEKEGNIDENAEDGDPLVGTPSGSATSVGDDEHEQDTSSAGAAVVEDSPSASDAEESAVVEIDGEETPQNADATLVPTVAAVRAEETPADQEAADSAPASPRVDDSAVANGAGSPNASGLPSSVSETVAAPNTAAVDPVETPPEGVPVADADADVDTDSGTEPSSSPPVLNALNLILSTGRAVNELLEDLVRSGCSGFAGGKGGTPLPGAAAGTAAAVCIAAEAWGAVALAVPQEAEGLAGPLREALTAPVDRCSVATRLALLHAVAVTVKAAAAEGEGEDAAAGGGALEAAEARGAAAALLRLLAPHALAGLKLEVDRVAAMGGGGGGDGETDEPREACLLEGVHIAQVAFKVKAPSLCHHLCILVIMFWRLLRKFC